MNLRGHDIFFKTGSLCDTYVVPQGTIWTFAHLRGVRSLRGVTYAVSQYNHWFTYAVSEAYVAALGTYVVSEAYVAALCTYVVQPPHILHICI